MALSGPFLYVCGLRNLQGPAMMRQIFMGAVASTSCRNHKWLFGGLKHFKQYCHSKAGIDRGAAAARILTSHSYSQSSRTVIPGENCLSTVRFTSYLSHRFIREGCQSQRDFHTSAQNAKSGSSASLSASEGVVHPLLPSQSPDTLIETWFYTVAPRGTIDLNLPFNTVVRPLNPQDHPDMDKAIIEIHFDTSHGVDLPPSHELSHIGDLYKLDVLFDQDEAKMNVTAKVTSGVTLPLTCMLWIPLQSDLKATVLSDKDVTVEKLESSKINLFTQHGNCKLKSLKCGSVTAQCSAGNIICKSTVLGNIIFHVGMSGGIQADKLQGASIVCQTEMGPISVKSLYVDTSIMRTTGGSVKLGQCHGQMLLQAGQSDVKIGSLEGDVDIGLLKGSVNLHLSRHSNSNIDIKEGDITLSFPEGTSTDLDLDCQQVNLDKNVTMENVDTDMPNHTEGYIGEKGQAAIHGRTLSGTINVKLLDWIHSTKLTFQQDSD